MPNQREIARHLGLAQSTVSMALRNDPTIPRETCARVQAAAARLGYRPNPMVASLMEHIRAGRRVEERACIAILVDAASEAEWLRGGGLGGQTYRLQYQGYREQAALRGYRTECFFLRAPGMTAARLDRIFAARGIAGVILAAPKRKDTPPPSLRWERYACATLSYSWQHPTVDRASTHFRHAADVVFYKLQKFGYRRPGMCLPTESVDGVDSNWKAGFLLWQDRQRTLPGRNRVPLFAGRPGPTPLSEFRAWLEHWKPDVLVGLIGHEREWLDTLGLRVPGDIAMVCLNRPIDPTPYAGIDENNITLARWCATWSPTNSCSTNVACRCAPRRS